MPLNKVEQIAALSLLAKPDYRELAWLVETTRNLTAKQKVAALAKLVCLSLDRNDDEARMELLPLLTNPDVAIITVARREAFRNPEQQATTA